MAIYVYMRVSTDEQNLGMQETQIAEHTKDWIVADTFKDEGVSGGVPANKRKGWQALMEVVKAGDTIVCYCIDRIGRKATDVMNVVDGLTERGIKFVTVKNDIDVSTTAGKGMIGLMAVFAEMEKDTIRDRVTAGMMNAKAKQSEIGAARKTEQGQIMALLGEGKKVKEVAEKLGISTKTVSRAKKAAQYAADEETKQQVIELTNQHHSIKVISRRLGLKMEEVAAIRLKAGLINETVGEREAMKAAKQAEA